MSAIFVTATGTDIGKTWLVECLLAHWRPRGVSAEALKPVASGFDPQDWSGSDPARLLRAMQRTPTLAAVDDIAPWRFRAPLSPDMAAAREGRELPWDQLLAFCRERIARVRAPLLIEGVGGVLVPLDATHTVYDWIAELNVPAVVVGGTYLGGISHVLTALAVLQVRGIAVRALVLNESDPSPAPVEEIAAVVARFTTVPIHLCRRTIGSVGAPMDVAALARRLEPEVDA